VTTQHSLFDVALIREALQDSGLTPSELAFRVDFAVRSLQRILSDDPDPGEIRVATLARLADELGLPLRSLIAPPNRRHDLDAASSEDKAAQIEDDDATVLIGLLYDRGAPTHNTHIAAALGWPLDRLRQALDEADHRLHHVGLRIARSHGESTVRPLFDCTEARRNLQDVRATPAARPDTAILKTSEHRAARNVFAGGQVSAPNETRQTLVQGRLANLGVLDTSTTVTVSEAARYAHPDPSAT